MAKAKQIEGLNCDADAAPTAAKVLRVRFDEMLVFHSAALDPKVVDGVHDMRVASRRFRSALRDFAPLYDKTTIKPLKTEVKEIADALGDIRDQDVAIEALGSLKERAPSDDIAGGIGHLIESRRAKRAEAHDELLKQVTAERLEKLRGELDDFLNEKVKFDGDATFRSFAADAIDRAHGKFIERSESIYQPFNDKALHKLRLSAKRLRYALELFDPCWTGELGPFAKYFSKIQSSLGKIHDSAEWIGHLSMTIRQDDDPGRQTAVWLISEFVSLHSNEYLKALALWNEWLDSGLEDRSRKIIGK